MLGKIVTVCVDRPLGSCHPEHKNLYYPVNYGYIPGVPAPDGEDQDAYVLGVDCPILSFEGRVIAVIHRTDDAEDKCVVVPDGLDLSRDAVAEQTHFQEKYFHTEIRMWSGNENKCAKK